MASSLSPHWSQIHRMTHNRPGPWQVVGVEVGVSVGVGAESVVGVVVWTVPVPMVKGALVPSKLRESLANNRASYVPADVLDEIV